LGFIYLLLFSSICIMVFLGEITVRGFTTIFTMTSRHVSATIWVWLVETDRHLRVSYVFCLCDVCSNESSDTFFLLFFYTVNKHLKVFLQRIFSYFSSFKFFFLRICWKMAIFTSFVNCCFHFECSPLHASQRTPDEWFRNFYFYLI
jgi:hypothetical protein